MADSQENPERPEELPEAKVKRRKRSFPIVWVVPLAAAIVAGYVVYDRAREFGPRITISFKDADGIRPGETPIKYRGIPIGQVTAVDLSGDHEQVMVKARLRRSAASIARDGSFFWIVRPEVGLENITGLGTVISGPHIEMLPGTGEAKTEFIGLEASPVTFERNPLSIVLRASRLGALRLYSPVYYRGIEVGAVQDTQLSANATTVDIHVFIKRRYANLVRSGTRFWNVSGADVSAGLLRGVEVKVQSLRSLVAGGIAFATPNDPKGAPAKNGTVFPLYDEAKKEWLEWAPEIRISR
jgi:paraquat-inducible protein B